MIKTYWIINTIIGSYIYGRETSMIRDKSKDYNLFVKHILGAPITTPIYLYNHFKNTI